MRIPKAPSGISYVIRLVGCRREFDSVTQPLPLVAAQFRPRFAAPRPEEAVLTFLLRQATRYYPAPKGMIVCFD
jgi:hypothetical protein